MAGTTTRTANGSVPVPSFWVLAKEPVRRNALLAASLGWMLDSMDVMLYSMIVPAAQRDLNMTSGTAGLIMSLTLIAAAAGGIFFGFVADRLGRTRALSLSILIYCVFTGLCAFVHSVPQLALCRMLLGLGMGGEWAAGAALVAETWPTEHRAKALGLVQSAWAIGYALAAAVVALVMPHFGWRAVFLVGLLPALVTVWIRLHVKEPETWVSSRGRAAEISTRQLFHGPLARRTHCSPRPGDGLRLQSRSHRQRLRTFPGRSPGTKPRNGLWPDAHLIRLPRCWFDRNRDPEGMGRGGARRWNAFRTCERQ